VGAVDDPALRALIDQAKRVCARHPEMLEPYLAAIRDKARGAGEQTLQVLLAEVTSVVPGPR
jgi:hypothetical protein